MALPSLDTPEFKALVAAALAQRRGVVAEQAQIAEVEQKIEEVNIADKQSVATQSPAQPSEPKAEGEEPKPKARATARKKPLFSLSDALTGKSAQPQIEVQVDEQQTEIVDSSSQERIEAIRDELMEFIGEWRPRFVLPFKEMEIEKNRISIEVPTAELRTEIERAQSELLYKVVEMAGLQGVVYLDITVNEKVVATRPIKIEDRIAYLAALNPRLAELKDKFNLYVE